MGMEYVKNLNPEVKIVKANLETIEQSKNKPKDLPKPKTQTELWGRSIKVKY